MARKKNIAAGQDAVIYARYSSHNQREVSIEQQVSECMKHAAELGLHVVGTYEDRAISGKTDNRPRFQQMMRDAEKGKFQAVVSWKSNRIGRNMLQAMVNEAKLDDYGVKVFYAEEDFDDTAAGRFALRNMMNVNQFYSENMAEDITRGLYDNASKCMANGRQPLGYKRGEDGRVVLDEANAAVVREIFTRVAAGDLFVDIARDLNAQGIKTSKGANWNKGSFQSICQNERYRGIYIYGDVRVADGIPRIVSDDLWYRVQEAMRMKKNPVGTRHRVGAEDYLLTGKLRCGHCGSYMTGVSGTSRNGELHYYYTCQKRRTEHACDKKNIRRDVIEPAVAQAIKMYCLTDDVIAWIADRTVEYWEKHDNDLQIEALEQQLEENKKATSNMLKAIEMGIITEATRTRMVELETEQSRLSVQLNAAKEDVVKIDREQIISYLELLQQGDIHDRDFQMELFKNFLVAVYVYDDNRMKLVFSCMGDQNSVEIPLETGEDPPDGGLSPDAKMFVLTPDSSTRPKTLHRNVWCLFCFAATRIACCFVFTSTCKNAFPGAAARLPRPIAKTPGRLIPNQPPGVVFCQKISVRGLQQGVEQADHHRHRQDGKQGRHHIQCAGVGRVAVVQLGHGGGGGAGGRDGRQIHRHEDVLAVRHKGLRMAGPQQQQDDERAGQQPQERHQIVALCAEHPAQRAVRDGHAGQQHPDGAHHAAHAAHRALQQRGQAQVQQIHGSTGQNGQDVRVFQQLFPLKGKAALQAGIGVGPDEHRLHDDERAGIDDILTAQQRLHQRDDQRTRIAVDGVHLLDHVQLQRAAQQRCHGQQHHMHRRRNGHGVNKAPADLGRVVDLERVQDHAGAHQIHHEHRDHFAVAGFQQPGLHHGVTHEQDQKQLCDLLGQ